MVKSRYCWGRMGTVFGSFTVGSLRGSFLFLLPPEGIKTVLSLIISWSKSHLPYVPAGGSPYSLESDSCRLIVDAVSNKPGVVFDVNISPATKTTFFPLWGAGSSWAVLLFLDKETSVNPSQPLEVLSCMNFGIDITLPETVTVTGWSMIMGGTGLAGGVHSSTEGGCGLKTKSFDVTKHHRQSISKFLLMNTLLNRVHTYSLITTLSHVKDETF